MNNRDDNPVILDYNELPPRREKHKKYKKGRKQLITSDQKIQREVADSTVEEANIPKTRMERLHHSALCHADEHAEEVSTEEEAAAVEVTKPKGALIFANLILWLFLILIGGVLFYVMTS